MKTLRPLTVLSRALPACAALAAAACGGDGTGAPRLTPQQVQGVYTVCTLRFTPTQSALPSADVLATVVNTTPPAPKQPPSLTLSGTDAAYQLIYTRRSDNFLQQLNGGVYLATSMVFVNFPSADANDAVRETLLPGQLPLAFLASQHRLETQPGNTYSVRRADYARAAGITEEGLQERISGQLSATFAVGACP
jgi:hypothetical protein